MSQSFYQFLMTKRYSKLDQAAAMFAETAFEDHSFPKKIDNYAELSDYFETTTDYLNQISTFDELWKEYNNI